MKNPIVGQQYLSRDRTREYTIISVTGTAKGMPVMAIDQNKIILTFTKEGYFISPEFPNPLDLDHLL